MNLELAAAFGHLPPNPEMVKEAACRDMFSKLAAEEGFDLTKLSDADVANEYAAFRAQIKLAEIEEAKVVEGRRIGRLLACVVPVALAEKYAAGEQYYQAVEQGLQSAGLPDYASLRKTHFAPEALSSHVSSGRFTPEQLKGIMLRLGYTEPEISGMMPGLEKAWTGGGAAASPGFRESYLGAIKGRTPMSLEELLAHQGGGAAKAEGLLSKLSPMGLGEAVSKGQWGRAAGKVAPIGAALLAGKWLMNRRNENRMAAQQAMSAPPTTAMAGV